MNRWLLFLVLASVAAGCSGDTFIDPFDNDQRYFTLYGYLDELTQQHQLRVIPIQRTADDIVIPSEEQTLNATVRTIDLATGQEYAWQYRLEPLADNTFAHVFESSFPIRQERTYRLEIERSDGVVTWAETTVPSTRTFPTVERSAVVDENGVISQEVIVPGASRPWGINVVYYLAEDLCNHPAVKVPYERVATRVGEGQWGFTINLSDDSPGVQSRGINDFFCNPDFLPLRFMGIEYRQLDAQWDLNADVLDPADFTQPDAQSNVVNGYGFFGSMAYYIDRFDVTQELSDQLGFPRCALANGSCDE